MTTTSRTDRVVSFSYTVKDKIDRSTQVHISALRQTESLRLQELRKENAKCETCTYHSKERFYDYCTKPEKKRKQVNPLAICVTWAKKTTKEMKEVKG